MQYLERLKEEKNLKWLIHEANRISEIVWEYRFRLEEHLRSWVDKKEIEWIILDNLKKLDLIAQYKEEVSKVLWHKWNKVLH